MDRNLQIVLVILVGIIALSSLVQVMILVGAILGLRRMRGRASERRKDLNRKLSDLDAAVRAAASRLSELAVLLREILVQVNGTVRDTRQTLESVRSVVREASERAKVQVRHADEVVGDVVSSVEAARRGAERAIEAPVNQARAIYAGVRAAINLWSHRSSHPAGERRGKAASRLLGWMALLTILGRTAASLRAQQAPPGVSYQGQHVAQVDLVARPSMNVEALRPLVSQKANEPYSADAVRKSVAALQATHQFSKVDVDVKPEAQGLHVTFIMEPAYYVGIIYFPGAVETFSYPRLLETVNYPVEDPYEPSRVQQGVSALESFFARSGYFDARIEAETQLDDTNRLANITYHVTLNRHAKFGLVRITGPPPRRAAELERALRSFRARLRGADLRAGKPYSPQRVQAATRFLQDYLAKQNHLASQIRPGEPTYDRATNRATLNLQVAEGPKVLVRVEGAHVSKRTLRKLIPIYEENSFDQDLVEEGERNLVSYFQAKGFFDVKVNPQVSDEPSEISLVYQVDRGSRHRVMSVRLTGNRHFAEDDLADQILVKPRRFLSRGKFSDDLLKRNVDNLTAFYINEGFADVKVQPKVVDREPKVYVTFAITEGERTLVDSLRIEGNQTQSMATLAPDGLNLRHGQPYSRARLNEDRNQIVASYLNLGYPNANFRATVAPLTSNPHRVAATYQIVEGPRVHVSRVAYLAGRPTRKGFLERNTQVETGSPLSEGKLLESESNLYNSGVFDWANVSPRRPITDQSQEQVLVRVHEAKRNSITYGVGFQSTSRSGTLSSGIVALPGLPTVGLPPKFKLFEKSIFSPLGSLEYSRLNMRGLGETASISTLVSRLDERLAFTYSQPRFDGLDWSAVWSVSAERTTANPLFTARLGAASFQLEKVLDAAKTKRLQARYTFQRTTLTDLHIVGFVPPEDTNIRTSILSTSFVRDTRDKPLDAHRGVFQTVNFGISPKVIGSTDNVVRFFGQTAFYRQVKPWMVWANNFRLGLVKAFGGSHVPISEEFFSGGYDSLRGFPLNGAGPQVPAELCVPGSQTVSPCPSMTAPDGKIAVPAGGHQLFIFNSEGRFPIPVKKGLGGVIFYDGGNVYSRIGFSRFFTDYSNSVGVGLRYDTPVGPVRIDIGRNLNPVPGLKKTQIFVTLGQAF